MFTQKNLLNSKVRRNAVDMSKEIILESVITCPVCGHKEKEIMPEDACVHFYECKNCKNIIKPKPGDCCVFCSYGTEKCPSKQV